MKLASLPEGTIEPKFYKENLVDSLLYHADEALREHGHQAKIDRQERSR
jgi:hypothetical protein